ncbi:MAG: protein kinase [Planctomycetota bacterium]
MKVSPGDKRGPYEIERELGRGAMGVVYAAKDTRDGKAVALKVLPPDLARGTRAKRFEREFELMKRLEHPFVARVFDSGADDTGAWYTMELLPGPTLGERIRSGAPLEEVVRHLIDLARALDAAHVAGIVHRDVKPENVLLGADGRARLVDFGIARDLDAAEQLTRTNALVGTPLFMSPEQLLGKKVDGRADIYALGAILYAVIAGRPFRTGASVDAVLRTIAVLPPPPSTIGEDVSSAFDAVVLRAIAPDADDRFQRASELALALEAVLGAAPSSRRWAFAAAAIALVGIAGAGGLVVLSRRVPVTPPGPPPAPIVATPFAVALAEAEALAAKNDPGALDAARKARQLAASGSAEAKKAAALVGRLLVDREDHRAALPFLREAEPLGLGRALVALARAEVALDAPHEAKVHARKAAAASAEDGEVLGDAGALLLDVLDASELDEAKKLLERAAQLRPRDARIHTNLGLARFHLRDMARAEDSFRAALDLEPSSTTVRNSLAAVLLESQRFDEASTILAALVKDEPSLASAWSNLARAHRRSKRPDDARRAIEKARALEPENAEHASEAGRIALDRIDMGAAEKAFADAVRLDPGNVEASVSLAAVLARQDRKDEAQAVLERIARERPNDPSVKKALDELRR